MGLITALKPKRVFYRIKNEPFLYLTIFLMVVLILFFVAFPLFKVITYPGLDDFKGYLTRSRWIEATFNSFKMALLSTLSTTICGFLFAYGMIRIKLPLKKFFETIAILPILSPPFVVAISYIMLFGGARLNNL